MLFRSAMLWSVMESEAEANALIDLASVQSCPVFLFNELALNVSWSKLRIVLPQVMQEWISTATRGPADYATLAGRANALLEQAYLKTETADELMTFDIERTDPWHPLFNHFITSHGSDSPIDLFSKDEGGQQEQLAVWLTDSLHPRGMHHSPQIPKGPGQRELTDILLGHEYGAFLIESKTLTIGLLLVSKTLC